MTQPADVHAEPFPGWDPPPGMHQPVITAWRAFYRAAWRNYGVTPAFYRALYFAQSGRCYICRVAKGVHPDDPAGNGSRRLGVDHNHMLGNRVEAVRGLLCTGGDRTCNRIIGWLNRAALVRAVKLLQQPPAQELRHSDWDLKTDGELEGWLTR